MITIEVSAEQLKQAGVAESLASLMHALGGAAPAAKKTKAKKAAAAPAAAPAAAAAPAKRKPGRPRKTAPKATAAPETISDLPGLIAAVSDSSRTFLDILEKKKQLTMTEAMKELGLTEKKAVGGVVGGISRKAQKYGLFSPFRSGKTDDGDRLWKWTGDVHNEPKPIPSKKKKRGRKPKAASAKAAAPGKKKRGRPKKNK